ncbi:hypothetical protein [Rhizomonospora bruguierae]|uniref:hypothetical protein n=1 Tax=Rhizomonospora bruguierae TaxID=1581705 RepID=UPI001BCF49D5|nr:hypothetical protein [Micromonospora sp. NBRC 107566]
MGKAPPTDLSGWSRTFSCYTAALAAWLAVRQERWWRPLLVGTPTLAIRPVPGGLVRFEHHPRPPLETLGLTVRYTDDWSAARAGYRNELAARGAVVICGDTYRLPWQRGYQRWHSPHWFTLLRHEDGWTVDDPIWMHTEAGPQAPHRAPVAVDELARWGIGPAEYQPAQRLRELSIVGSEPPGIGRRYRWLVAGEAAPVPDPEPCALTGRAAVRALADMCRHSGPEVLVAQQADDLWQALRQRELLLAAGEVDPDLVPPAIRKHWQAAIPLWRRIPPVLMDARLCMEDRMPVNRRRVADVIEAVADFEGQTVGEPR